MSPIFCVIGVRQISSVEKNNLLISKRLEKAWIVGFKGRNHTTSVFAVLDVECAHIHYKNPATIVSQFRVRLRSGNVLPPLTYNGGVTLRTCVGLERLNAIDKELYGPEIMLLGPVHLIWTNTSFDLLMEVTDLMYRDIKRSVKRSKFFWVPKWSILRIPVHERIPFYSLPGVVCANAHRGESWS